MLPAHCGILFIKKHLTLAIRLFLPLGFVNIKNGIIMKDILMGLGIQLFNPQFCNIEPVSQLGICVSDSGCGTICLLLYLIFLRICPGWRCHGVWNQHRGILPIVGSQRSLHGLYLIPVNGSRLILFGLDSGSYIRNLISHSRLFGF